MTEIKDLEAKLNEINDAAIATQRELADLRRSKAAALLDQAIEYEEKARMCRDEAMSLDPAPVKQAPKSNGKAKRNKPTGPTQSEVVEALRAEPQYSTSGAIARCHGWDADIVRRRLHAAARAGTVENTGSRKEPVWEYVEPPSVEEMDAEEPPTTDEE